MLKCKFCEIYFSEEATLETHLELVHNKRQISRNLQKNEKREERIKNSHKKLLKLFHKANYSCDEEQYFVDQIEKITFEKKKKFNS